MTDSRRPDDPSEPRVDLDPLLADPREDSLTADEERELLRALAEAQAQAPAGGALAAHERAWERARARQEQTEESEATQGELTAMARGDDAGFLEALRAAHAPDAIGTLDHERIVRATLVAPVRRIRPAVWAASGFAVAAAVLLGLRLLPAAGELPVATRTDPAAELSRSTESLVVGAAASSTSGRVERIAQARTGDYRKNRFRSWGAR